MPNVVLVSGSAGTGKTYQLMRLAAEKARPDLLGKYGRVLAVTFMHGSRRRLAGSLQDAVPTAPKTVMTIDSFALDIVNRWRSALGYYQILNSTDCPEGTRQGMFCTELDYDNVRGLAAELLSKDVVRRLVGLAYPICIVDEFQDCDGPMLELVCALAHCSQTLAGADHFQYLDGLDPASCPAIDRIQSMDNDLDVETMPQVTTHRTDVRTILETARRLRSDERAGAHPTVPVLECYTAPLAAWVMLERMFLCAREVRWTGSTAVLYPGYDSLIPGTMKSIESQLAKRHLESAPWIPETSHLADVEVIQDMHGERGLPNDSKVKRRPIDEYHDPAARTVVSRVARFARLKGMPEVPVALVTRFVQGYAHERHAFGPVSATRVITSIHGAKNREFDNVFVLWNFALPNNAVKQRKLLYNAVTRAKKHCAILVFGPGGRALKDPSLSLLDAARPALTRRSKKTRPR